MFFSVCLCSPSSDIVFPIAVAPAPAIVLPVISPPIVLIVTPFIAIAIPP